MCTDSCIYQYIVFLLKLYFKYCIWKLGLWADIYCITHECTSQCNKHIYRSTHMQFMYMTIKHNIIIIPNKMKYCPTNSGQFELFCIHINNHQYGGYWYIGMARVPNMRNTNMHRKISAITERLVVKGCYYHYSAVSLSNKPKNVNRNHR